MKKEYQTVNPSNGQRLNTYQVLLLPEIDQTIEKVKNAQLLWRDRTIDQRIECVQKIKALLLQKTDQYARLITNEMGKTLKESIAEIKKCAFLCDYYAEHAKAMLSPQKINYQGLNAERVFAPLGLIYMIMPWNFPFWQVFRAAIPNILIGNGIVLKHAENVIGSACAIEALLTEAIELPLLKNVVIDLAHSEHIIKHCDIAAVTLTGSNRSGSVVAKQAGEVCKKTVLELGGSDAYIIRKDINVEEVAKEIVNVRMLNSGQVCISPKRLIVDKSIKVVFEQAVLNAVNEIVVGDPLAENTTMGPIARADLRDNLHRQIEESIAQGAKLLTGGHFLETDNAKGFYYAPTVLTDVTPSMQAFQEELFGPVIAISYAGNDEEAIELANNSKYGLGSAIFTKDIKYAKEVAEKRIEAGMCFINQCVASHPALPFGGVKQSGYGRECSQEALRELANIKTVLIGS
ncbi:aldehyde dehydrogenase family protein [Cysteiniphilum sp. QT6929]|uniref:aldehyde dehydrogenase family protein n=1 Tax=Cysteiniphilum sp. QT6929 TaxID=2975055 RepID=UPI0024B3B4B0|nr:aldehyde dehydrogenase family protein [Cysteiniphilum sp. QT6929]WHN65329.1 aldehyde dehydrogenase family protein [Cysteiniphilum sp. QT6929]